MFIILEVITFLILSPLRFQYKEPKKLNPKNLGSKNQNRLIIRLLFYSALILLILKKFFIKKKKEYLKENKIRKTLF